jgi:hypothetical protein
MRGLTRSTASRGRKGASKLLGWLVPGLNRPTPFFDDRTKGPTATPRESPYVVVGYGHCNFTRARHADDLSRVVAHDR